jgi:RNA polymerase sigma-70 factor (ECF subfamily)
MLEDITLIWKFRSGESQALARIYDKYRKPLLRIATGLLNQTSAAEDVVHEVFLQLARSPEALRATGNLQSFLATCVVNRVRNLNKAAGAKHAGPIDETTKAASSALEPARWLIADERLTMLNDALATLPYEQREAVILHLQGGMRFREIARFQDVSINTVHSRYRYGLDKLRSLLNDEI